MTIGTPVSRFRLGEAAAGTVHAWGGRLGALIVVCAGMWIVRRRRPWNSEEVWTFVAMLVWIAGDIVIDLNFTEAEAAKKWSVRLLLFLILAAEYVVLRSRQVAEEDDEVVEVEETIVLEAQRERDKV